MQVKKYLLDSSFVLDFDRTPGVMLYLNKAT